MPNELFKTLGFTPLVFGSVIFVANTILPKLFNLTGVKSPEEDNNYYKDWKFHMDVLANSGIANAIFVTTDLAYETIKTRLQDGNLNNLNIKELLKDKGKFLAIGTVVFTAFLEIATALEHLIPNNPLALTASIIALSVIAAELFKGLTKLAGIEMTLPLLFQFAGGMYMSTIIGATQLSKLISSNLNIKNLATGGITCAAVFLEGLVGLYGGTVLHKTGQFIKGVGSKIYGCFFANPEEPDENQNPLLLGAEQPQYDTLNRRSISA